VIRKQIISVAAAPLLITGMFIITSRCRPYFHGPGSSLLLQAERKDKSPAAPIILPGHSGSIRRGVCRREAIKTAQPIYPTEAAKQGIKGIVIVEIIIDEKGHVESVRGISGPDTLKDAAEDAAKKWRFRVTRIGGKPAKTACSLSFLFPPVASQIKKTRRANG
jgi:TonB family protein